MKDTQIHIINNPLFDRSWLMVLILFFGTNCNQEKNVTEFIPKASQGWYRGVIPVHTRDGNIIVENALIYARIFNGTISICQSSKGASFFGDGTYNYTEESTNYAGSIETQPSDATGETSAYKFYYSINETSRFSLTLKGLFGQPDIIMEKYNEEVNKDTYFLDVSKTIISSNQAPSINWSGEWKRGQTSTLTIGKIDQKELWFELSSVSRVLSTEQELDGQTPNFGDVSGNAIFEASGNIAKYKSDESDCQIEFRINGDTIIVVENGGCIYYEGGGVHFDGYYFKNNEKVKPEISSQSLIAKVSVERAYFYAGANIETKRKAYLIFGQNITYDEIEGDFLFAQYTNERGVSTKGWMLKSDFVKK